MEDFPILDFKRVNLPRVPRIPQIPRGGATAVLALLPRDHRTGPPGQAATRR